MLSTNHHSSLQWSSRARRWAIVLLGVLAALAPAGADVAYLRDGRNISGTVTQTQDTVIIEQADGTIVRVPADDVLHIAMGVMEAEPEVEAPPLEPEGEPDEAPPEPPAIETVGRVTPPTTTFAMNRVVLPESIAFMLMRRLANPTDGQNSYQLHQDLARWQAAAHDRLRRIYGEWTRPVQFTRHRQSYLEELAAIEDLTEQRRRIRDDAVNADEQRAQIDRQITTGMLQTARLWLDPDIRMFLQGIAHHRAGNYQLALQAFETTRQSNPLVAAYHQGAGMCLIHIEGRELEGLASLINEVMLQPNSKPSVYRLSQGLAAVPGHHIQDPTYLRARDILATYPSDWTRQASQRTFIWQMPGARGWGASNDLLPEPTYDRLLVRQAVGVPIADTAILVDRRVVQDALAVLIRIDSQTVVVANVPSARRIGSDDTMVAVSVSEFVFDPLATSADIQLAAGDVVEAFGLGVYPEMGTEVRSISTALIAASNDRLVPEDHLAAGESASPVVTPDGRLVGALAGRTDVLAEQGGEGLFVDRAGLQSTLDAQGRSSGGRSPSRRGRIITPQPAPGRFFIVYGLFGEKLD